MLFKNYSFYNFCQIFYSKMVHFIIFAKYCIQKWFILYEKFGSFMANREPMQRDDIHFKFTEL